MLGQQYISLVLSALCSLTKHLVATLIYTVISPIVQSSSTTKGPLHVVEAYKLHVCLA